MKESSENLIDFASNDYLGFSKNNLVLDKTQYDLVENNGIENRAIDSRLILENYIAQFHQAESALIYNSGADANLAFFNAVPQKGDLIYYDELCHISIQDAIQLSNADFYIFQHIDFEDLERLLEISRPKTQDPKPIFIVTESIFSMDGDMPNLEEMVALSEKHNCHLVIDESHSVGVFGENGQGLVQNLQLEDKVFARIISFDNALGCEGGAIIGSKDLKKHLDNSESNSVTKILAAYQLLESEKQTIERLRENIVYFNQEINLMGLKPMFVRSKSAVHSAIIPGNQNVKSIADQFQEKGFDVKAILSPEVPEGQERLRFCIHSFNTKEQISQLLGLLSTFVFG